MRRLENCGLIWDRDNNIKKWKKDKDMILRKKYYKKYYIADMKELTQLFCKASNF